MRAAAAFLASIGAALLCACTAVAVPPTVWLRLPAVAAGDAAPGRTANPAAAREVWQLQLPLAMPAHLERDVLFVPQGTAGAWVRPLAGARWVEPLRDAVPRLLREDLVRRSGAETIWASPLPAGLVPTRLMRVEITAFEIGADGRALGTQARWTIADARGARAPSVHEARFETAPPAGVGDVAEGWALAHRHAITTLASRIAATMIAAP